MVCRRYLEGRGDLGNVDEMVMIKVVDDMVITSFFLMKL